jgi:hypothetical protein
VTNVEMIHLRADFESLRAKSMTDLRDVMPSLRDMASALKRPSVTEEKRQFLADVLSERLDLIQDVINRLDKAKVL